MINWHILTGEYPPQPGGVSDYTQLVARHLVKAGDTVHVWTSPCLDTSTDDHGVIVHRLRDNFGPRSLRELGKALSEMPKPHRLLVQYVPHAFGWKALNIPFCVWLWSRRKDSVWVVFHEVAFPLGKNQSTRHNALGVGTRLMASLVVRAAERLFVSTESWTPIVNSLAGRERSVRCLPIPSNIPVAGNRQMVTELRNRYPSGESLLIGHFGTYGTHIAALLTATLPSILLHDARRIVVLLGRGSENLRDELIAQHPEIANRLHASGILSAEALSCHLQVLDLMLQPYPDGISTRRTSIMACLQHGIPTITTTGQLTEAFWSETDAVVLLLLDDVGAIEKSVRRLQDDQDKRTRIGTSARTLYDDSFDIRHTIAALRGDAT